jgi:hypothetical protein
LIHPGYHPQATQKRGGRIADAGQWTAKSGALQVSISLGQWTVASLRVAPQSGVQITHLAAIFGQGRIPRGIKTRRHEATSSKQRLHASRI